MDTHDSTDIRKHSKNSSLVNTARDNRSRNKSPWIKSPDQRRTTKVLVYAPTSFKQTRDTTTATVAKWPATNDRHRVYLFYSRYIEEQTYVCNMYRERNRPRPRPHIHMNMYIHMSTQYSATACGERIPKEGREKRGRKRKIEKFHVPSGWSVVELRESWSSPEFGLAARAPRHDENQSLLSSQALLDIPSALRCEENYLEDLLFIE